MFGESYAGIAQLGSDDKGMDYDFEDILDFEDVLSPYLFPACNVPHPWNKGSACGNDFILISEFCEQEGPKPLITIPTGEGGSFDKNEFVVRIISVDHQTASGGFSITDDTQVVMTESKDGTYAYVHHFTLFDHEARGFVRPFCMSYVTADRRKLMSFFEDLSSEFTKVSRYFKYGNKMVFVRDLDSHLKDIQYTRDRVVEIQSQLAERGEDKDKLEPLLPDQAFLKELTVESVDTAMKEVEDILRQVRPQLNDPRLEERFKRLEQKAKSPRHQRKLNLFESVSLNEEKGKMLMTPPGKRLAKSSGSSSGSYEAEYPFLCKRTDYRPKVVRLGRRKFEKSLRGMHELCQWGAKEGLNRLRSIHKYFSRDSAILEIEKNESALIDPHSSLLAIGRCVATNFLHGIDMQCAGACWSFGCANREQRLLHPSSNLLRRWLSNDTLDSYKSLDSFLSVQDDDTYVDISMSSAKSSYEPTFVMAATRVSETSPAPSASADNDLDSRSYPATASHSDALDPPSSQDALAKMAAIDMPNIYSQNLQKNDSQPILGIDISNSKKDDMSVGYPKTDGIVRPEIGIREGTNSEAERHNTVGNITFDSSMTASDSGMDNDSRTPSDAGLITETRLSMDTKHIIEEIVEVGSTPKQRGSCDIQISNPDHLLLSISQQDVKNEASVKKTSPQNGRNLTDSRFGGENKNPLENEIMLKSETQCSCIDAESVDHCECTENGSPVIRRSEERCYHGGYGGMGSSSQEGKSLLSIKVNCSTGLFVDRINRPDTASLESVSDLEGNVTPSSDPNIRKIKVAVFSAADHVCHMSSSSPGHVLLRICQQYANLDHVILSLLSGRPVVVAGSCKTEREVRDIVTALELFLPGYSSTFESVISLYHKRVRLPELMRYRLIGLCRPDNKSIDSMIPNSVKRYVTLFDVEKRYIVAPPYQGQFVTSFLNKARHFKAEESFIAYIHSVLLEVASKAFVYYHTFSLNSATSLRRSSPMPVQCKQYRNSAKETLAKLGVHDCDMNIVQHLVELIKQQQIEDCMTMVNVQSDMPAPCTKLHMENCQTFRC